MKRVRIAQIGTGHDHAIATFRSLMAHPEAFELVGVAEPNPQRVKDLYTDAPHCTVDELLAMDDLDAVAVETEESLSTEYAQLFADRGIAIHLDKPGAQNLETFTKLIETVNQRYGNTIIMVTHNDAIKDMADRVVKLRDGMIRKNYRNEVKIPAIDLEW